MIRELRGKLRRRWKVVLETDWENQLRGMTELAECRNELRRAAGARAYMETVAMEKERLQKQVDVLRQHNERLLEAAKALRNMERTAGWYADSMEQQAHIKAWFVHKDHPLKRSVFYVLWSLINECSASILDPAAAGTAAATHAAGGAHALKSARDIMQKYFTIAHTRADEFTEQEKRGTKRHGY